MFPAPRSRATLTIVLLLVAVALTSVLAWEAVHAARSHRAAAESVLRDYAAFAAWEFSRVAKQHVVDEVHQDVRRIEKALQSGDIASALATAPACASCGDAHRFRTVIAAPADRRGVTSAGEAIPAEARHFFDSTAPPGAGPHAASCVKLQVMARAASPLVAAKHPMHDAKDAGSVGFIADASMLTHVFERVLREHPLLPPTLTEGSATPNDALLLRVLAPDGDQLFASSTVWSTHSAEQPLGAELGGLRVAAALHPDAASRLVIGGLPRDRLPLIGGLFALTAGLVVVALVQLRREAEIARLRADFVSGVSHELRTPLAQIRMFSETLLLGRVRSDEDGRRSLEIIAREAGRLTQLVENVLLFSRGERQTMEISKAPVRLAPVIGETVENFAPLAASRHASVTIDAEERLMARVDTAAVRRILLNLLDNAAKYGPEGQTISIGARFDDGHARLEVTDEGPGIERRDVSRIWEPFQRLESAAAATGGAGIGLAIVRQLVELHGGSVAVERVGRGSRFVVSLPDAWLATDAAVA